MSYPINVSKAALSVAFSIDLMIWELHPDEVNCNPREALVAIIALLEPIDEYSSYMTHALLVHDLEVEDFNSAYDHAMWFVHLWMDVDIANLLTEA